MTVTLHHCDDFDCRPIEIDVPVEDADLESTSDLLDANAPG